MIQGLIDALLPSICVLCDQRLQPADAAGAQLCRHCHRALPWNQPCCRRCALPLRAPGTRCATCRAAAPPFARVIAPLRFESMVQTWLHALKFHHGVVEGKVLGELLAAAVLLAYPANALPQVVLPVPLSRRRLAWRGHNQALCIAAIVARRLGLNLQRQAVRRARHTPPQAARSRSERQHNLAGAFTSKPWPGTRIAVVDDVMTTGATAAQVARTLLAAGAAEVHVWVPARTPAP